MTDALPISPAELTALLGVIAHPEHQRGLEDRFLTVVGVEPRAAHLVRLTGRLSGDDELTGWDIPNATVRLELPGPPPELAEIAGAPQTTSRVYTVADFDAASRSLLIDLVRHPEASPAMQWLDRVRPGDTVRLIGPRPHRIPGEGSPRILLADSSALPAALSILQRMPAAEPTTLIAAAPADELALLRADLAEAGEAVEVIAVNPDAELPLSTAFAEYAVPAGASVWASGERDDMRAVRNRCREDLGLPGERAQVFGYWKRGVSNTRIDFARLKATHEALAAGRQFGDTDDFEIGI